MLKIKVCGMRDLDNIRRILRLKPDYMGFIFSPASKRYVGDDYSLTQLMESFGNCKKVGVFVNASFADIDRRIKKFNLDALQLHGEEKPEFVRKLKAECPHIEIWKAISVGEKFDNVLAREFEDVVHRFVFDSATADKGGSGISFNWNLLLEFNSKLPFFIAGGIGPANVKNLVSLCHGGLPLFGIDINSAVESAPGMKDEEMVQITIEAARV